MTINQLDLILYDMYRMDTWMPPLYGKWTDKLKKESYSKWAVDELREFITKRIYPHTDGSIKEFCELTNEFMVKMSRYSKANPKTSQIFQCASSIAANVMDLLQAMK